MNWQVIGLLLFLGQFFLYLVHGIYKLWYASVLGWLIRWTVDFWNQKCVYVRMPHWDVVGVGTSILDWYYGFLIYWKEHHWLPRKNIRVWRESDVWLSIVKKNLLAKFASLRTCIKIKEVFGDFVIVNDPSAVNNISSFTGYGYKATRIP